MNDYITADITCPHCSQTSTVYHMDWSAVCCVHCDEEVSQEEFVIKYVTPTLPYKLTEEYTNGQIS